MNLKNQKGVTLLEILLVLAIAATIMVMFIGYVQQRTDETRRARAAIQMQQILNAGLSYYVAKGNWPDDIDTLKTEGYLPSNQMGNPWGGDYKITSTKPLLYVSTDVKTIPNAQIVVGRVPLGFIADDHGMSQGVCTTSPLPAPCTYVVGAVNIPGQNLNNATAVNFSGIYHTGACVPVPECPVDKNGDTMEPEIMVSPVSVSGVNADPGATSLNCQDPDNYATCKDIKVTPVSSFTAKAYGPDLYKPYTPSLRVCDDSVSPPTPGECMKDLSGSVVSRLPEGKYWRVCLYVTTADGKVSPNFNKGYAWGQAMGSVLAITRCKPKNEEKGSSFKIWDN